MNQASADPTHMILHHTQLTCQRDRQDAAAEKTWKPDPDHGARSSDFRHIQGHKQPCTSRSSSGHDSNTIYCYSGKHCPGGHLCKDLGSVVADTGVASALAVAASTGCHWSCPRWRGLMSVVLEDAEFHSGMSMLSAHEASYSRLPSSHYPSRPKPFRTNTKAPGCLG